MLPSADRSERYALESLQPRILLSADVEVALDAEVGVQDTFVAVEAETMELYIAEDELLDPVRVYKGEGEEEVFVDPDGIEYVQSDLYRTLEITEEAPVDEVYDFDPSLVYMTCGLPDVLAEGEEVIEYTAEEVVDPMIYTCYLPLGEGEPVAEEEVVEVVDEELVDPIMYTCYFPLPEEVATTDVEETPADEVLQATVELTAVEEEAPADEEAAVAVGEEEAAAGGADEVNPLLSDSDDLLVADDALLA